nr:hypothetical protein [Sunxiuqinia sp.]
MVVWDNEFSPGCTIDVPVHIINDTCEKWNGFIELSVMFEGAKVHRQNLSCELAGLGKELYEKTMKLPYEKGKYELVAEITYNGESVKSIRDFKIK